VPDTDPQAETWLELNRDYSDNKWPNITRKGEPPADAEEHRDEVDKYNKYFSDKPGSTDGSD
jgi:ferredoxin